MGSSRSPIKTKGVNTYKTLAFSFGIPGVPKKPETLKPKTLILSCGIEVSLGGTRA